MRESDDLESLKKSDIPGGRNLRGAGLLCRIKLEK
jgi:hypothetical protein